MKAILTSVFFCTWLVVQLSAQPTSRDSIPVTIIFNNKKVTVDSVFVIFDKYDLTGAGVVKQVFYPSNNRLVIHNVPKGKYYVDVFCIGMPGQNYSRIRTISKRRDNSVTIPLKTIDTYIPGTAVIPSHAVDFNNLVVTSRRLHR